MNSRLKELMLEAGYAAPELAGRANKLAELIVEECCRAIRHDDQFNGGKYQRTIKQHFGFKVFGVEE